jgi:plastocyanin
MGKGEMMYFMRLKTYFFFTLILQINVTLLLAQETGITVNPGDTITYVNKIDTADEVVDLSELDEPAQSSESASKQSEQHGAECTGSPHRGYPGGHPGSMAGIGTQNLKLNIFSDFTLTFMKKGSHNKKNGEDSNYYTDHQASFSKHHFNLIGRVSYNDFVSVLVDVIMPADLLEFSVKPRPALTIKMGLSTLYLDRLRY